MDEPREEPKIGEIIQFSLFFIVITNMDEKFFYGKPILTFSKPFINGIKPGNSSEYMLKRPFVNYKTLQDFCDSKIKTFENFIQIIAKLSNAGYNYQNNIDKTELTNFKAICD